MPKVHKLKARKAYPAHGIKKGDTYYKWSLRAHKAMRGVEYKSKEYPKPWQLTSSPFRQTLLQIEDRIANIKAEDIADLEAQRDEIAGEINELAEECQGSLDNMPEGLQQGDTGQMLQERVDNLQAWASDLESLNFESEEDTIAGLEDDATEEDKAEAIQSALDDARDEMQSTDHGL